MASDVQMSSKFELFPLRCVTLLSAAGEEVSFFTHHIRVRVLVKPTATWWQHGVVDLSVSSDEFGTRQQGAAGPRRELGGELRLFWGT